MREVVGEGALFTAGGVVFFQEGKQAGPKGCGPTMIPNSWARAFERYVSSSYPPRVILVQLLFRCNPTMIKIYGFPCNWTSVYIYIRAFVFGHDLTSFENLLGRDISLTLELLFFFWYYIWWMWNFIFSIEFLVIFI